MASDPHVPRSRLPEPKRGLTRFLLRTRAGQILSVLALTRLLGAIFSSWPAWLTSVATVGLWGYAIGFLIWRISRLRTKLLWRIRRKLVISYLLIGLVPTLLILFFFLLSAFFIVGQVSSYVLNTEIRRVDSEMVKSADLAVSDVIGSRRGGAHVKDEAVRAVLRARIAPLSTLFPGSGAVYLEHRRGRIQRVIASGEFPRPPQVGTPLPSWMESAYHGPIRIGNGNYLAGTSTPMPEGLTVLVASPLRTVLDRAAVSMGFHIDQLVTSVSDAAQPSSLLVVNPQAEVSAPPADDRGRPFTLPWLTLLQSRSLDAPRERETELVFVQFGFAPMSLYDAVARNALQLGPEGPDLGKVILWVLALLAALFLVIEVAAIFVGLVLARSITGSVHALTQGTEHVRQGDFGYKVQVRSRDQLGELADSFNLMTNSIQDLLTQSAEKERLEEELRIARTIQMSLLPKDRVSVPGLSIAALCLPANEVGGDYYDFIPLSDGRLAILIADVSGKGTSAALYMAELKGVSLSLSRMYDSPRLLLIEANKILAANLDSRSFITHGLRRHRREEQENDLRSSRPQPDPPAQRQRKSGKSAGARPRRHGTRPRSRLPVREDSGRGVDSPRGGGLVPFLYRRGHGGDERPLRALRRRPPSRDHGGQRRALHGGAAREDGRRGLQLRRRGGPARRHDHGPGQGLVVP